MTQAEFTEWRDGGEGGVGGVPSKGLGWPGRAEIENCKKLEGHAQKGVNMS